MTTLRYLPCPCCGNTIPASSWDRRAFGNFKVDVRLCSGRKGFRHIGSDDLNDGERAKVSARLLGSIQAAMEEGILTREDLAILAGSPRPTERYQMPLPLAPAVVESVIPRVSEYVRPRVSEEIHPRVEEKR